MPTVFRDAGFDFRIYTNDHGPSHVHVLKAGNEAVINLGSATTRPLVRENFGMSTTNLRKAFLIVNRIKGSYFKNGDDFMAKVKMGRWEYTEQELANMFDEATIRGKLASSVEPQAKSAYYDRATNRVVVDLKNGATFIFPYELAEGLRDAAADDIAHVELGPRGASLRWDKLDVDFSIVGLMSGVFGSKLWMAKLGRKAGGAKTKAEVSRSGSKRVGDSNRDLKRTPSRRKLAKQPPSGRAQERP